MVLYLWSAGFGLLILLLLVAATNTGLRMRSIVHVSSRLREKGRENELRWLTAHRDALSVATATLRTAVSLALVLVIVVLCERYEMTGVARNITSFVIAFVLISVFGVAIPATIARYAAGSMVAVSLPSLHALHIVSLPMLGGFAWVDGIVRRLVGAPPRTAALQADEMEKEILSVVSEGELQGAVDEQEKEMIESVIEFGDTDVGEIMTPRTDIVAIDKNATLADAKKLIAAEGHSRIPVFEETIDNILGVLYAKDLLPFADNDPFEVTRVMRSAPYIPDSKPVDELLQEFKDRKVHIAIVLDEYGGTAGLVTIEDIIEELVGEITDEFEDVEPDPIQRIDDQTVEVDARVRVDVLNHELDLTLPEHDDYETIGGLVFSSLGRIPQVGETCSLDDVQINVIEAEERKINRLRLNFATPREHRSNSESD